MSIFVTDVLQYGTNSHPTTSEAANFYATDLLADGVIGSIANTSGVSPSTGSFAVNASATPDTNVQVTPGVIYVTAIPTGQGSQRLRTKLTTTQSVAIATNTSGGTRYDFVYVSIDPTAANNPAVGADNVASLAVSRSTSPVIDNGTGVTFGYLLAVVIVTNGFVTITNANITDKRTQCGVTALALSQAWATYTPTWTNTGGSTTLGNGTLTGAWQQINKTVNFQIEFLLGSTTSISGAGSWHFSLPSNTSSRNSVIPAGGVGGFNVGTWYGEHPAVTAHSGWADLVNNNTIQLNYVSGSTVLPVTNVAPRTWTSTDYILITGSYEAA